jgi:hypothetical protein
MNYFQPYSLPLDETIVAAWDSQVVQAAETPWLAQALATQSADLFPRFAACYAQLRALPRGARRALQRQLARSREVAIPSAWQRKLAQSLAGAALLLALGQGVQAATINVAPKVLPGINTGDGKCSLIEAIISANNDIAFGGCTAGSSADTIVLPAKSSFTLTTPYTDAYTATYGPAGLPTITTEITITGNGAKISRSLKGAPSFRLVNVSYDGNLTLDKVTISGGSSTYDGGGIYNAGILTITDGSIITGNKSTVDGGGVFNDYAGALTIHNSTISKNIAYYGGGIRNDGHMTVDPTTITGNIAYNGGGVFNYGTATFAHTTISANIAKVRVDGTSFYDGNGGGIYNSGYLSFADGIITKNTAYYGGGIFNYSGGEVELTNSTISGNIAKLKAVTIKYGGYTYNYFHGGVSGGIDNRGTLTTHNSTITGNSAVGKSVKVKYNGHTYTYSYGGRGGGIGNYEGFLYLNGGSITKNSATFYGGGLFNDHGSIPTNTASISANKAPVGADYYDVP